MAHFVDRGGSLKDRRVVGDVGREGALIKPAKQPIGTFGQFGVPQTALVWTEFRWRFVQIAFRLNLVFIDRPVAAIAFDDSKVCRFGFSSAHQSAEYALKIAVRLAGYVSFYVLRDLRSGAAIDEHGRI